MWFVYHLPLQALVVLSAMWEAGCELTPDAVSYNAVLKACGAAGQIATAMQVHGPPTPTLGPAPLPPPPAPIPLPCFAHKHTHSDNTDPIQQ